MESQVQLLKQMLFIPLPRSSYSVLSYVLPLCLIERKEEHKFFSLIYFLYLQLQSLLQRETSLRSHCQEKQKTEKQSNQSLAASYSCLSCKHAVGFWEHCCLGTLLTQFLTSFFLSPSGLD